MLIGEPARFAQVLLRQPMNAALTQNGLEEDGCRVWSHRGPQVRNPVAFGEAHIRNARTEINPVLLLPGHRHGAVRAAVVRLPQGHDLAFCLAPIPSGMRPRQF